MSASFTTPHLVAKPDFIRELKDAFPVLQLAAPDRKLRARRVTLSSEQDDMGPMRIARYRISNVLAFLHANDLQPAGTVSVFVDMAGCVRERISPMDVARAFLAGLQLADLKETWANTELQGIYEQRLAQPQDPEEVERQYLKARDQVSDEELAKRVAAAPDMGGELFEQLNAFMEERHGGARDDDAPVGAVDLEDLGDVGDIRAERL